MSAVERNFKLTREALDERNQQVTELHHRMRDIIDERNVWKAEAMRRRDPDQMIEGY